MRATSTIPADLGQNEDQFLCITVREARNLIAKDYETASSDPFAKVILGPHVKKSRVIYRNRHPMWQQRLLFPLDALDEGEPLLVELWDKDFAGIEFLGQVIMTLGKAIEIAEDASTGRAYWFPLAKKRSTDIVGGELCLGFEVMDALTYAQVAAEVEAEMDPDSIAASLEQSALLVQLHGLNGLKANNLQLSGGAQVQQGQGATSAASTPRGVSGKSKIKPRARWLFIRFGRFCLEKPLPPDFDESGGEFEVPINEEVLIPLAPALRHGSLASRRKDELYDIKVYVKGSSHTIAKTQIPIWDIPNETSPAPVLFTSRSNAADDTDSDGSAGGIAEAAVSTPRARQVFAPVTAAAATASAGRTAAPSPRSGGGSTPQQQAASAAAGPGRSGSQQAAAAVSDEPPATPSRLERALSPSVITMGPGGFPRPLWLGGSSCTATIGTPAPTAASTPRSPSTHGTAPSSLSLDPLGPDAAGSDLFQGASLVAKKRTHVTGDSDPGSPRTGEAGFTIPAIHLGDVSAPASDDEAGVAATDAFVQRSKSDMVGSIAAALQAPSKDSTTAGAGRSSNSSGASGASKAAGAPALQPPPSPSAAPAPAVQCRKRAGAAGSPSPGGGGIGGSSDLSRRLRSMLAPGSREVSRMGWAPLGSTASYTGEDEAGTGAGGGAAIAAATAAAPAPAGGGSGPQAAGDAWGNSWKGLKGKRYVRTLESHLSLTAANIEVALSLRLVRMPSSQAAPEAVAMSAEGTTRVIEDDDDDEDVPDAVPLSLPPALSTPVVDTSVNMGVNSLYSLLFGGDSNFLGNFWVAEDLREVTIGPWDSPGDVPSTVGSSGPPIRLRTASYVKPLRIPIPLAPKQCNVWEEHRLISKCDGGWVVECKSTNDAPKGDCFYVMVQLCGVHRASGQSQLRISMQMFFFKPCLGKGMIQHGAESDARRSWANFVATLQRHISRTGPVPALTAAPAAPARGEAPVVASAAASASCLAGPNAPLPGMLTAGGTWGGAMVRLAQHARGASRLEGLAGLALQLALLVALLGLTLAVRRAGMDIAGELRELSAAVRQAARAGNCLMPPGLGVGLLGS